MEKPRAGLALRGGVCADGERRRDVLGTTGGVDTRARWGTLAFLLVVTEPVRSRSPSASLPVGEGLPVIAASSSAQSFSIWAITPKPELLGGVRADADRWLVKLGVGLVGRYCEAERLR